MLLTATSAPAKGLPHRSPGLTRVAYVEPKAAEFRSIYDAAKGKRVLERLATPLSHLRLRRPLTLKLDQCGDVNSWYDPQDRSVTVCYEYLKNILDRAPSDRTPAGVTRHEALEGPLAQVLLHESGHAVFDLLSVPIFGREEDAADQFAAYVMLLLEPDEARQLIDGSAFFLASWAKDEKPSKDDFSDEHGLWSQRFYNLVCLAYGSDEKAFGYLVERGYLPRDRAEGCGAEYDQVAYAVRRLIAPHLMARTGRPRSHKRRRPAVTPTP